LADFLADHPIPDDWELNDDLQGEDVFYIDILPPWEMYFDGAARRDGTGVGVVFVSPEKHILLYSFALTQLCSNNVAEYRALSLGLVMATEMGSPTSTYMVTCSWSSIIYLTNTRLRKRALSRITGRHYTC